MTLKCCTVCRTTPCKCADDVEDECNVCNEVPCICDASWPSSQDGAGEIRSLDDRAWTLHQLRTTRSPWPTEDPRWSETLALFVLTRRQQPWIHPARVQTHTSTPTPDHMRSFLSPEVPVGDPFDSPTYYSIVGTSMHGIHAIVTTAEYDFFALACDRAGAFPRRGGTGAAGHSMALQRLAEALKGDADSMDVEPDVDLQCQRRCIDVRVDRANGLIAVEYPH